MQLLGLLHVRREMGGVSEACATAGGSTYIDCWCNPCCSLDNNALCGVDPNGRGKYTIEGITALAEGLKQSNIQSLR